MLKLLQVVCCTDMLWGWGRVNVQELLKEEKLILVSFWINGVGWCVRPLRSDALIIHSLIFEPLPLCWEISLLSPNYRRELIALINLSITSIGTASSLQTEVYILLLFTQRKAFLTKMPAQTAHMKTHADKLSASWQEALHMKDKVSEILIYWRISTRILKLTQID